MTEINAVQYDLAPLIWWQNPWLLMRIGAGGACLLLLIGFGYRHYTSKKRKAKSADQWQRAVIERLKRLSRGDFGPAEIAELVECLRIIAVFERYAIYRPTVTDNEFLALLLINNTIPERLHLIFLDIFQQATQVKFAQGASDSEKNREHINMLIQYLEESA